MFNTCALAALAAVSAASAQSTVQIYGRAHLALDSWSATGSTAGAAADYKARNRMSDESSRIGFRINEDLGGGLRAFSVIETGVVIDTATANGQNGEANSGAGFFGTREAHVGIGNAQAEVRLGRQNVFWGNGKIEDVSANMIHGGVTSAYTAPSSGYISTPAARVDNTVKVVLHKALVGTMFAGSEVWYSAGTLAEKTGPGLEPKAQVAGFTLKAEQGPFAAQYDYGRSSNTANDPTSATNTTVTGGKLGLAYFYAPTSKVTFINSQFKQTYSDAGANSGVSSISVVNDPTLGQLTARGGREQSSNAFGVQHDLGGGNIVIAQYVKQGDVKNAAGASQRDTGSTAYAIGYQKVLSKRTSLNAAYTIFNNDANNTMANTGGGQSSAVKAGVAAGSQVKMIGVGIQHNF